MRLLEFWNKVRKTPAKDWYYSLHPEHQTPNDIPTGQVKANASYINVHLKSMRIVNVRNGFKTFYPVVHSFISLKYLGNSDAEFNVVTTPNQLAELDSSNLDRIISINKRLLGPTPYRGGDVLFDIGLFSVKSGDLSKPFLSLLTDMSNIAGVSFLGKALPFVDPISKGVDLLVGNTSAVELEVGISTDNSQLIIGYYVLIADDKQNVQRDKLFIDPSDFKLTDDKGTPFRSHPYLVLSISTSDKKEDWFDIPELAAAYKKLQDNVRSGDINAAKDSLTIFKRFVLTSNDLLSRDAKEIAVQVERETNDILATTQVAQVAPKQLRDLSAYIIYR
jgi:hypothetical protein